LMLEEQRCRLEKGFLRVEKFIGKQEGQGQTYPEVMYNDSSSRTYGWSNCS